jgi:F-type H+-transporting ATPase subunit a
MAEGGGGHSPLEQFEIKSIFPAGGHGEIGLVDFTNSSLTMVAALVLISAFLILGMRRGALVPGRMQSLAEMSYEFVAGSYPTPWAARGGATSPSSSRCSCSSCSATCWA